MTEQYGKWISPQVYFTFVFVFEVSILGQRKQRGTICYFPRDES